MKFGEVIRAHRRRRELTLRGLAKLVELTPSYVSRIENSDTALPTEAVCRRLAAILELDPDELTALAGRVPQDVKDIILRDPIFWTEKIRGNK